jgi:hypothetical protein
VITLDMVSAGLPSLTDYLSRPMTREETAKLTPVEMKARRLAQTRACRARQRVAAQMAKVARHDAKLSAGRDIIRLSPVILVT